MSIDDVFAIDMTILFLVCAYVPFLMFITVVFGYLTTGVLLVLTFVLSFGHRFTTIESSWRLLEL